MSERIKYLMQWLARQNSNITTAYEAAYAQNVLIELMSCLYISLLKGDTSE
jgi:hypothetical protein